MVDAGTSPVGIPHLGVDSFVTDLADPLVSSEHLLGVHLLAQCGLTHSALVGRARTAVVHNASQDLGFGSTVVTIATMAPWLARNSGESTPFAQ